MNYITIKILFLVLLGFHFLNDGLILAQSNPSTTLLNQGWSNKDRETFYFTPQGSLLIPLDFAKALLTKDTNRLFFTKDNLKKYGFVNWEKKSELNPLGLPIGFAIDGLMQYNFGGSPSPIGKRYLGLNCAACHTSQINFGNKKFQIDGGQANIDFQSFIKDLDGAIEFSAQNKKNLSEFVARVFQVTGEGQSKSKIIAEFSAFVQERRNWQRTNSTKFVYGYGRVDAFGIIMNQVLSRDLVDPRNAREPNAPVSYPVLWTSPYMDRVQWNGHAMNDPQLEGPMARNIGQTLGVFGRVFINDKGTTLKGFCSSVRRVGLQKMSDTIQKLKSPKWPESILGAIDKKLAQTGKELFKNSGCIQCHSIVEDSNPKKIVKVKVFSAEKIGTDSKFIREVGSRTAFSGTLEGRRSQSIKGRPLKSEEKAVDLLDSIVLGALVGSISPVSCSKSIEYSDKENFKIWKLISDALFGKEFQSKIQNSSLSNVPKNGYIARPLNGIWSSAPYLHNGSIPNLRTLLTKPELRPRSFYLGCNNFDSINVGFDCKSEDLGAQKFDSSIYGNFNAGHTHGTDLSDKDKSALIEYLKSI